MSGILQTLFSSISSAVSDTYFKYVTLLLHGDGTNAGQNNTFLDSSTNNFTITRNGNTTQGTFTPFSQAAGYWGNYFNGSTDYLTIANNSAFALPGDFTIELWANFNSNTTSVFCGNINSSGYGDWAFFYNSAFGIRFLTDNSLTTLTGTYTVTIGTWTHFAISRSGTSAKIFANGTLLSTTTNSSSNTFAGTMYIGQTNDNALKFPGYLSNLRIVKGTAVYTSAFTPSTTPLTAITNTSLLTCQSNRFVDNSANNFTLTPSGTPSVQPFSPFAPTAAYSTSVNGGSGYFDGTGDYLVSASSANLTVGTGDFTLESWIYITATSSAGSWYNTTSLGDGTWNGSSRLTPLIASNFGFLRTSANTGVTTDFYFNNAPILPYQWNHIVLQRSGTTITAYCNGYQCTSGSIAGSVNIASTTVTVGGGSELAFPGYISSVRLLKGTALYSGATYTVPTAPLTAVTNTQLLLSCTNAAIYDNAIKNDLETVGNAQISTSVKKYGTGSLAFDGTGDRLSIPMNQNFVFGTGDFTIEGWVYLNVTASRGIIDLGFNYSGCGLYLDGSNIPYFRIAGTDFAGGSGLSTSTWYHFAITRSGTSVKIFINGTQSGSTGTNSSNISNTLSYCLIGAYTSGGSITGDLNGYIDDLRITKGIARYTANFTPPTQAFPNQ